MKEKIEVLDYFIDLVNNWLLQKEIRKLLNFFSEKCV